MDDKGVFGHKGDSDVGAKMAKRDITGVENISNGVGQGIIKKSVMRARGHPFGGVI